MEFHKQTRKPRFMMPDGSRPMPRRFVVVSESPRARKQLKRIGPRPQVLRNRVLRPRIKYCQDEAHSEIQITEGPVNPISQVSEDSPFDELFNHSSDEEEKK